MINFASRLHTGACVNLVLLTYLLIPITTNTVVINKKVLEQCVDMTNKCQYTLLRGGREVGYHNTSLREVSICSGSEVVTTSDFESSSSPEWVSKCYITEQDLPSSQGRRILRYQSS